MELTFLAVVGSAADPTQRVAQIVSFVLDKGNSITSLGDIMGAYLAWNKAAGNALVLSTESNDYEVLSAGVIISARAGNTYVYTNSKMCKSWRAEEAYSDGEDYVIASYMEGGSSRDSELILQQASNKAPGNRVVPSSIEDYGIELASGVTGTLSSDSAGLVTMTNGDKRILIANALGQICGYDAATSAAVPVTITPEGGAARPLTLADTTFAGNGTITVADLQAAGFSISLTNAGNMTLNDVTLAAGDIQQGYISTSNEEGNELKVDGSGITQDNVYVMNASTGDKMAGGVYQPTNFTITLGGTTGIYYLMINGAVYATLWVEA